MPDPMVDGAWLREHIEDPNVRVVEIQYEDDVDEYADGHIPGAVNWYWKDVFWDPRMRDFVTPAQMAKLLGGAGISPDTTIVFYSGRMQYGAYGAWALKTMAGHADVRVLNGGRRAWKAAGGELTLDVPADAPAVDYVPSRTARDDSSRASRQDVLERLGRDGVVFLDARYEEEYVGDRVKPGAGVDHGAERHGRIPGAVNLPFRALIGEDFHLRPVAELEAAFRSVGAAPDQTGEVIAYCRLGHRASLTWFAATQVLGWDHFRAYDGSWTEWGSMVGMPVER